MQVTAALPYVWEFAGAASVIDVEILIMRTLRLGSLLVGVIGYIRVGDCSCDVVVSLACVVVERRVGVLCADRIVALKPLLVEGSILVLRQGLGTLGHVLSLVSSNCLLFNLLKICFVSLVVGRHDRAACYSAFLF